MRRDFMAPATVVRFVPTALIFACAFSMPLLAPPEVRAEGSACPRGSKLERYEVKPGDRLGGVAKARETTIADVVKRNPGLDPDSLREGQKLDLCVGSARKKPLRGCGGGRKIYEHKVHSGESLVAIAKRYDVPEAKLLARNAKLLGGEAQNLQAGHRLSVCTLPSRANAAKACGYRTPLHDHLIVPGEWLAEIASRYGVPQRDIVRLNPRLRRNPDYLRPGRKLRVCPDIPPRSRERIEHRVAQGEVIATIAERYGLHPLQLVKFQLGRLTDPDKLDIGQRLILWQDGDVVAGFGETDDAGSLEGGLQLPGGSHYRIKNPNTAWGTARTVRLVQVATATYRRKVRGAATVLIGDLSRKGGGKFPPHKSHQTGVDVDVGYALRDEDESARRFRRATAHNLDVARTWRLLDAFLATDAVRYIFMDYKLQELVYEYAKSRGVSSGRLDELFQYPRGKRRAYGIIRDDPGHDDHFHIRFQ